MEYRAHIAREERNLGEAERIGKLIIAWDRRRLAPLLAQPLGNLDAGQRNRLENLATSLQELGQIQREEGRAECEMALREAFELAERVGDKPLAGICAFNLGRAYTELVDLRNLPAAEHWYRCSLELFDPGDLLARGKCAGELGRVALARFREAKAAGQPAQELLDRAAGFYRVELELLPIDEIDGLAVAYNQLGNIYCEARDFDSALPHYQKAIRYRETQGDLFEASRTRYNVALGLAGEGRFADALVYAEEALRGYTTYGERAEEEVDRTQRLVERIQKAAAGQS
jgi:tetratricopeptide (TPR) repeat protein